MRYQRNPRRKEFSFLDQHYKVETKAEYDYNVI